MNPPDTIDTFLDELVAPLIDSPSLTLTSTYWNETKASIKQFIENRVKEAEAAKDNAYWERNQLVAALSKIHPAWLGYHDGKDWEDDWRTIVYIKTPTGQLSWHIHDDDKQYFTHLDPGLEEWDGHTTEEKYERLKALTESKGD